MVSRFDWGRTGADWRTRGRSITERLAPHGRYLNLARIAKPRDVTGQSCRAQAQAVGRRLGPTTACSRHWLPATRHRKTENRPTLDKTQQKQEFPRNCFRPLCRLRRNRSFSRHTRREKTSKLKTRRACQLKTSTPDTTQHQPTVNPRPEGSTLPFRNPMRAPIRTTTYNRAAQIDLTTESSLYYQHRT
jgi:hypothetical protein